MKSYIMVLHLVLIFLSIGCKEDDNIRPFGKDVEAGAPGVVSEIKVKNIPGGAVISYQLPDNPDIMYVRARYKVGQGKEMEARASVYANELTVNGFGDMNEHEVELSCVDRMENEGATTVAVVTPLKPSVLTTFESLEVNATFGGVYVNFKNPEKASLSIHVVTTDSLNQPYEAHVQYTQAEKGPFYVRGFKAEERMFDIYVVDRWGNSSDTLYNVSKALDYDFALLYSIDKEQMNYDRGNEAYKLSTAKILIELELKPDEIIKLNLRKKISELLR